VRAGVHEEDACQEQAVDREREQEAIPPCAQVEERRSQPSVPGVSKPWTEPLPEKEVAAP